MFASKKAEEAWTEFAVTLAFEGVGSSPIGAPTVPKRTLCVDTLC